MNKTYFKIQPRTDKTGETSYVIVDERNSAARGDIPSYKLATEILDLISNPKRDILAQV